MLTSNSKLSMSLPLWAGEGDPVVCPCSSSREPRTGTPRWLCLSAFSLKQGTSSSPCSSSREPQTLLGLSIGLPGETITLERGPGSHQMSGSAYGFSNTHTLHGSTKPTVYVFSNTQMYGYTKNSWCMGPPNTPCMG